MIQRKAGWEPSMTARGAHAPPRVGLSAARFTDEAQKHRRWSRWKAESANVASTRRGEQKAIWSVCATRGGVDTDGGNNDHQWNPNMPAPRDLIPNLSTPKNPFLFINHEMGYHKHSPIFQKNLKTHYHYIYIFFKKKKALEKNNFAIP